MGDYDVRRRAARSAARPSTPAMAFGYRAGRDIARRVEPQPPSAQTTPTERAAAHGG